eukprot:CAMPEP_0184352872 /NCGR_PEP_ID=MMETSP1089-20130417/72084_1 /TAXON_ID=38269 ORGANISM="Gloeochaete wittrockiana, Strain SAG46.84" /NCGR_SAMPLE_ID=MMETSP1089 /ASSEMBLY_ACC=CAM_ASM_000445 /LENGTH=516 /DNA_ID=CAMNT_0026687847 /DNA_START=27 /DNA_END=1577 /DNA_ORIENTATION=+
MLVWLPWAITAGVFLGLFVVIAAIMFFLSHKEERSPIAIVAATAVIFLIMACIAIVPADIYNTSHSDLSIVEERAYIVEIIYYVLYSLVIVTTFIVVPFCFFYSESFLDDDTSVKKRLWNGFKFTIFFCVILVVLLVIGLFLRSDSFPSGTDKEQWQQYIHNLYEDSSMIESSIAFTVFCLSILGYAIWLTYTSYGMTVWALNLIKGRKRVDSEIRDTEAELAKIKQMQTHFDKNTKRGKKQYEDYKQKEIYLEEKLKALGKLTGGCRFFAQLFVPFKILIGFGVLGFSAFILVSIVITQVNRLIDSDCTFKCGFIMTEDPTIPNPIDMLLTILSKYYPLDYIAFSVIVLFLVAVTAFALMSLGVRLVWVKLYNVGFKRTTAQALVSASLMLVLSILVLNTQLLNIAPQYVTYGSRTYVNQNNETVSCGMNATISAMSPVADADEASASFDTPCPMSTLATIFNQLYSGMGFFGIVFYIATWAWVIAVGIFFALGIFWCRKSNVMTEEEMIEDEFL